MCSYLNVNILEVGKRGKELRQLIVIIWQNLAKVKYF